MLFPMASRKAYFRIRCLLGGQPNRAAPRPSESRSRPSCSYSTKAPEDISSSAVIFSGIQPTGVPHLGNYLGALREWVRLQGRAPASSRLIFSIVDLHALTVPQSPSKLRRQKIETFATLLAIGLDPEKSTIFYQSTVWPPYCL